MSGATGPAAGSDPVRDAIAVELAVHPCAKFNNQAATVLAAVPDDGDRRSIQQRLAAGAVAESLVKFAGWQPEHDGTGAAPTAWRSTVGVTIDNPSPEVAALLARLAQ